MKYDKNSYGYAEERSGRAAGPGVGDGIQAGEHRVSERQTPDEDKAGSERIAGENRADCLQESVYKAGMRLLYVLSQRDSGEAEGKDACDKAEKTLGELGDFYYNIGFAGEQSCGKSTVINSLLQYPLMPTCNLTTTCTVVRLIYGAKIRVTATDDDTGQRIFDADCTDISEDKFHKLKEYVCLAMPALVIDNINYFTDQNIYGKDTRLTMRDIDMDRHNPREVALLFLILLSVYIGQNDPEMTAEKKQIITKRNEVMRYFGMPEDTVNYSVLVQWDSDLLKSGLVITDLPGLGASAEAKEVHGRVLKSHDDITKEAIQESDAMVFLEDDTVKNVGTAALREMLSSAKLKEVVNKGGRIIPVLNKADRLEEAQMITSRQKFVDLLLGANVRKQPEDIMPYSAIYGECAYHDIPLHRTLFMRSSEAKVMWSMGQKMHLSEKELMNNAAGLLKEKYEKSGVEELKSFFRTSYVERGKYNKALAAVCAVRNLAIQVIAPMESRAKAYRILRDTTQEAVSEITGGLKDAALDPVNDYTGELQERIEQVTEQTQLVVEAMLESETALYQKAFDRALDQYKSRLLNIVDDFSLTWSGLGSKAQINVVGSGNYNLYQKLLEEMEVFPVDVVEVNGQYEKILGYVDGQIDQIYQKAMGGLKKLKTALEQSVGQSVENAKARSQMSAAIVAAMTEMGGTLLKFLDKQLLAMSQNLDLQRDGISDAGNAVVARVMTQNTDMTGNFTENIKDSLQQYIKNGFFFSKREYLIIDGSDGLKEKIKCLTLTQEEKDNLEINIRFVGSQEIVGKLNQWMDQAGEIIDIYTDMGVRIKQLMDETAEKLSDTEGDSRSAYENLLAEISALQMEFFSFQQAVQEPFDEALAYFRETEPNILRLKHNVLIDV